MRLARFFGGSPEFWLNMQTNHDLAVFANSHGKAIEAEVVPLQASA